MIACIVTRLSKTMFIMNTAWISRGRCVWRKIPDHSMRIARIMYRAVAVKRVTYIMRIHCLLYNLDRMSFDRESNHDIAWTLCVCGCKYLIRGSCAVDVRAHKEYALVEPLQRSHTELQQNSRYTQGKRRPS